MEIKTYAVGIPIDEAFNATIDGSAKKILAICEARNLVGMHMTPDYQCMLFKTKDEQVGSFKALCDAGFNAKIIANPAYVDSKYLKK